MSIREHMTRVAAALSLPEILHDWQGLDTVWPIVERLSEEGGVFVLKLDGERSASDAEPRFTVLVSGTHLARPFRCDSNSLEHAIASVLADYAADQWGVPLPCG